MIKVFIYFTIQKHNYSYTITKTYSLNMINKFNLFFPSIYSRQLLNFIIIYIRIFLIDLRIVWCLMSRINTGFLLTCSNKIKISELRPLCMYCWYMKSINKLVKKMTLIYFYILLIIEFNLLSFCRTIKFNTKTRTHFLWFIMLCNFFCETEFKLFLSFHFILNL